MKHTRCLEEEERKLRRLRFIVDFSAQVLAQEKMTIDQALDLINATKQAAVRLFPGSEQTFDMIYGRRFQRILRERFASAGRRYPLDQADEEEFDDS
ncbi:MAG: hypothetical protein C4520_17860 [Candidatus Abyssobacteria bacterium SURF_5]|uniref:Uncharacterized protein n=1 Tax=Abyssobacteria bacterium (strain SURF_5) TaxID=2093360 RepID=A0A3A4N5A1_ABYX5|nr:MAG: hypothetical protein C4520_17860 [Candidatus Abyssubacteria bacterium SURF_5]